MKRWNWGIIGGIVFSLLIWFGVLSCFAADIEIDEAQPTITKMKEGDLIIHTATKQAIVTLRKGYDNEGEFIPVSETNYIWMDVTDNPETPEDETSTAYTDFMTAVVSKPALRAKVIEKLGE